MILEHRARSGPNYAGCGVQTELSDPVHVQAAVESLNHCSWSWVCPAAHGANAWQVLLGGAQGSVPCSAGAFQGGNFPAFLPTTPTPAPGLPSPVQVQRVGPPSNSLVKGRRGRASTPPCLLPLTRTLGCCTAPYTLPWLSWNLLPQAWLWAIQSAPPRAAWRSSMDLSKVLFMF